MFIIFGLLTGFFGWTGGRGEDWAKQHHLPPWLFRSWTRDWIIAPLCAALAYLYGVHSWWVILSIPLTGAALSTYWDDKLFNGVDNFWFHGLMVGLAAFPIAIASGHWWLFALRAVVMAVWMGAWSWWIKDADLEEFGRYTVCGATVWMLC
jgi:hypothetical protein